jgi:phospholipid/cholesterol/gamma-HCH transport system substrate-binding protein
MKNNSKWYSLEFAVGLFFLGAVIILLYLTIVVNGKELFFGRGAQTIAVLFPSVEALNKNDKVYCLGLQVGRVKEFSFDEKNESVKVILLLEKKIVFREGYSVEIRNASLLGGKYVYVNPGPLTAKPLPEDSVLNGTPPVDIISEAGALISNLREDEATFRNEFLKGQMTENLKNASEHLNKILSSINSGEGSLAKLLNDGSMYTDAKKTLADIDAAAEEFKKVVADLHEGKGTMGKLFANEEVYNDLKQSLADLKKFSAQIAEGKGSLGRISSDDGKLYEELSEAVKSLNKVAANLAEGKGTLGKMLSDDSLYYETKSAVYQLKGAVEDFREQAPIATFGSMLLGAL